MTSSSMETEKDFLREIELHPDDNTTRLIYADWLDEQGDPRGEYLRIHCELASVSQSDERYKSLVEREKELQLQFDAKWLDAIGQPRIKNCEVAESETIQFEYECPKAWSELTPTQNQNIRHCSACQQEVFHCHTVAQLGGHVRLGHCVAIGPELIHLPIPQPTKPAPQHMLMGIVAPGHDWKRIDESERPESKPKKQKRRKIRRKKKW